VRSPTSTVEVASPDFLDVSAIGRLAEQAQAAGKGPIDFVLITHAGCRSRGWSRMTSICVVTRSRRMRCRRPCSPRPPPRDHAPAGIEDEGLQAVRRVLGREAKDEDLVEQILQHQPDRRADQRRELDLPRADPEADGKRLAKRFVAVAIRAMIA
jgi:hypothetical protein